MNSEEIVFGQTQWALDKSYDGAKDQSRRLSTWLLVGNAAALVFMVTGMAKGELAANDVTSWSSGAYLIGLVSAFAAGTADYLGAMFVFATTAQQLGHLTAVKMHSDEMEVAETSEDILTHSKQVIAANQKLQAAIKRLVYARFFLVPTVFLYLTSAYSFCAATLCLFGSRSALFGD